MNPSVEIPDRIFLVGAGAAGSALCRSLTGSGHGIRAIASRSLERAQLLAAELRTPWFGTRFERLEEADLIILAVPDDSIAGAAEKLSAQRQDWTGCIACHLSGALSSSVLEPLSRLGAYPASLHPMVSIRPRSAPTIFDGVRFNIEGHDKAVAVLERLVREIGGSPFVVDRALKLLIHLAASITSNYVVTLTALATELLRRTGMEPEEFDALLRPLMDATFRNIQFVSPAEALTGPVARADVATVRAHLELVATRFPEFLPLIVSLVSETTRMAVQVEKITLEEGDSLLDLVSEIMESSRA